MKKLFVGLFICFINAHISAQVNLVPNPSFEEYDACPFSLSCFEGSETVFNYVLYWMRATGGSSDYFNICADESSGVDVPANIFSDYTPAHTGDAYGGMYQGLFGSSAFPYREYVQTKLIDTLIADDCYYVEFYARSALKLSDPSFGFLFTSDDVQAYFSAERPFDDFYTYNIDADPQVSNAEGNYFTDTSQWTLVGGFFEAEGDETWLTIGNFKPDEESDAIPILDDVTLTDYQYVYLFVDDVLVTPLDSLIAGFLKDTIVCAPLTIIAPAIGDGYIWSTGDTTQMITVTATGDYWLEIETPCGVIRDTATVTFVLDSTYTTSQDLEICFNELPYTLESVLPYDVYVWSTGSSDASINIDEGGIYFVSGYTGCANFVDTFHVHILPSQDDLLDLGNDTLMCADGWQLQLEAPAVFDNIIWSTGETTAAIFISNAGEYSVSIETDCEIILDTILITEDPFLHAQIDLGDDQQLCPPGGIDEFILQADTQLPDYLWSTGETDSFIIVTEPGLYWLRSELLCNTISDTVVVSLCDDLYIPNAFSPNGDGINDTWQLIITDPSAIISIQVFNRWGEVVAEGATGFNWDGNYEGQPAPVGVYVYSIVYMDGTEQRIAAGNITLVR